MQALKEIPLDKARPSATGMSLVRTSSMPLPPSSVKALAALMAEAQAYFSHQSITTETAAVWLGRWGQLTEIFGLEVFTGALSKVVFESRYLPMPVDIENECRSLRKKVREKAEWEQERQQQEDMQRRRREHPEEYCTLKEIVDEVTKKRGEANSSDIAAETQATVA